MPKRRRNTEPRHLVLLTASVETGNALDEDGHRTVSVVKLTIVGRWIHGQDQTLSILIPGDAVASLGALLTKAAPPPDPPATTEAIPSPPVL